MGDFCADGRREPTANMIGGDWNCHIDQRHMELEDAERSLMNERVDFILHHTRTWSVRRATHPVLRPLAHRQAERPLRFTFARDAAAAEVIQNKRKDMRNMFGRRPSAEVGRR